MDIIVSINPNTYVPVCISVFNILILAILLLSVMLTTYVCIYVYTYIRMYGSAYKWCIRTCVRVPSPCRCICLVDLICTC